MCDVIKTCLADPDQSVQLHAAKVRVNVCISSLCCADVLRSVVQLMCELGSVACQKFTDERGEGDVRRKQVSEFWQSLLSCAVAPSLQSSGCAGVCAALCDAMATIGEQVFERFQV